MVKAANEFAAYACTWSGRRLYWALLLLKYQAAMADPEAVEEPSGKQICKNQCVKGAVLIPMRRTMRWCLALLAVLSVLQPSFPTRFIN